MRQVLFVIPGLGIAVHGFSLMLLLACYGALLTAIVRARRAGVDRADVVDLAFWLFPGGIVGARVVFLLTYPEEVHSLLDVVRIWRGGIVFYGCILGGLIGSVLFWTRRRFPFLAMADAVAPALAVGVLLGRLGCFLNGCCYGAPCTRPWAVRFPAGTLPWGHHVAAGLIPESDRWSLAVHPTQLYDAAGGLLLLGLLTAYAPRRRRDGEVMALLMIAYPILRFLTESLRDDDVPFVAGLSIAQAISVGLFLAGLATWAWLHRARPADGIARPPHPQRGQRTPSGQRGCRTIS